jgi:arabinose-5-phosphate isomerase
MRSGDAVPLKPLGTGMADALAEMSAKGLGCVVIVDGRGHVAGIITDGDLRRKMRADLLSVSVDEIMTANPRTVRREALASEALEILNSAKITTLVVTDGAKPVGILHMHDLLRAGVA